MKRIHFVKLLLVTVLALPSTFDVYGESPYVGTFPKSGTISNNSYTLGDVTWGISTTSGTGSPSITFGSAYSNSCIKFGSGANNCYGSVTLSTDYFLTNSLVVKSVKINAIGSATKNVTMEIGSSTTTVSVNGSSWTNIELKGLNVSSTTLSMVFKLNGAGFFINSITIEYSSSGSGETTKYFNVSFVDKVQGTNCSSFDMTNVAENTQIVFNSIDDKPQATTGTCEQTHYHFVGWIEDGETPNETGSNVIAAGTTSIKATKDVTYKAVWAQEAN